MFYHASMYLYELIQIQALHKVHCDRRTPAHIGKICASCATSTLTPDTMTAADKYPAS